MLFWKEYSVCDCFKTLFGDVSEECKNVTWKKTLKVNSDFKGFYKDEELQKSTRLWLR